MSPQSPEEPQVVSYNIPRIEVYQVTDDELVRIEEAAAKVGNEFALMLTAISITTSLLIALSQGEFQRDFEVWMKAAAVVSGIVSVYAGTRWLLHRSAVSKVLAQIRSRRTEPSAE